MVFEGVRLRKGRPFYCSKCREKYRRLREETEAEFAKEYPPEVLELVPEGYRIGRIKKLVRKEEKRFGFIYSAEGKDYHFTALNLRGMLETGKETLENVSFEDLKEGQYVAFLAEQEPGERAGRASDAMLLIPKTVS